MPPTQTPWPGLAERYIDRNGNAATRYWVHPQLMVGGSILTREDWWHIRDHYGLSGVLSVESQPSQEGEWMNGGNRRLHLPFEDDGKAIPSEIVMKSIGYARRYFERPAPDNRLYVHCALGGARSPSIAYAICRRVFDWSTERTMAIIRCARPEYGVWRAEEIGSYLSSIERTLASGAPEIYD